MCFLHDIARDTIGITIKIDDVSGKKKKKFGRFYISIRRIFHLIDNHENSEGIFYTKH